MQYSEGSMLILLMVVVMDGYLHSKNPIIQERGGVVWKSKPCCYKQ